MIQNKSTGSKQTAGKTVSVAPVQSVATFAVGRYPTPNTTHLSTDTLAPYGR